MFYQDIQDLIATLREEVDSLERRIESGSIGDEDFYDFHKDVSKICEDMEDLLWDMMDYSIQQLEHEKNYFIFLIW